jgi:membrane-associated protease RseP (regulator of RpoE activity)
VSISDIRTFFCSTCTHNPQKHSTICDGGERLISPGATAGASVGDKIVAVNGRDISSFELYEIREILARNGETVNLEVTWDGKAILLSLLLRSVY